MGSLAMGASALSGVPDASCSANLSKLAMTFDGPPSDSTSPRGSPRSSPRKSTGARQSGRGQAQRSGVGDRIGAPVAPSAATLAAPKLRKEGTTALHAPVALARDIRRDGVPAPGAGLT